MQKSIEPNDRIKEYLKIVADRESFWSRKWVEDGVFESDPEKGRDKVFITFPYPYMNGSLHLGHAYSSGRLDVLARYYRMKGYNVLYPWAWHWTGEAVLGTIHRLLDGDISVRKRLIELDGADEELIDKFKDPVFFVRYFTNVNREVVKRYGLSIDWRREFHTSSLHPLYNKFVEWQIRKLYKKGYIGKGLYPAVWCPRDQSPTGDHDRLEGVGVRPEEYTLVKFKLYLDDTEYYLVAGTFRPETIYGATNIWVNPDTDYVIAEVDDEKWIISKEAAFKLGNQLKTVKVIEEFKGSYIVGLFAEAPILNRYIPILPARFVDPDMVTGVVYSVPGHAPYDYLALRDITDSRNIDPIIKEMASRIKPLSIIKVEGYGDYPAIEIVEEMGIKSQEDYEKADEATQKIYKIEYHRGVMKENCGPISNMPVSKAKEIIKSILLEEGLATTMYDLPEKVICRCGTKCIVKIITDQWYLKYSDPTWKKIAYEALNNMKIYPDEAKKLFDHYIDWYEDWPCTRKTGLGTPFPFDKDWIVETLTDSTVYMAFYIVAKYYNKGIINVDKVDAIIGAVCSSVTLAIAPIVEENKVVLISPASTNPKISEAGDYIFRVVPSDALRGEIFADYIKNDVGLNKVAILYINNEGGVGNRDSFKKKFEELGGKVVAAESYKQGARDVRTQLIKIKNQNPQAIIVVSYPADSVVVLKQAKELGLSLPLYFQTEALEDPSVIQGAGEAAEGVVYILPAEPSGREVEEFRRAFKEKFSKEPALYAAEGFDAFNLIIKAIKAGIRTIASLLSNFACPAIR